MIQMTLTARYLIPAAALAAGVLLLRGGMPARAAGVTLNGVSVPALTTTTLPAADFEKLHRGIAPGKERWAEIPWETDLAAARARSSREGRPLLMWVMDGHPLGCT